MFQVNKKEAFRWYSKAADLGNSRARYNVGECYAEGLGVDRDYVKAIQNYKVALADRYGRAAVALIMLYAKQCGGSTLEDCVAMCNYAITEVSDREVITEAQYMLSYYYEHGLGGVVRSPDMGYRLLLEASNHWELVPKVMVDLAAHYKRKRLWKKAFECYQMAAEKNVGCAFYNLAVCYDKGLGTLRDTEEGFKYYKEGAKLNDADCLYQCAKEFGRRNRAKESSTYFRKAFQLYESRKADESPYWALFLAKMCFKGLGMSEPDPQRALAYLEAGIEEPYVDFDCMLLLGVLIRKGSYSLVQDEKKAFGYVKRAADEGESPKAMYVLSCFLEQGVGCAPDEQESRLYLEKAANTDENAQSMLKLAPILLEEGKLEGMALLKKLSLVPYELPVAHFLLGAHYLKGIPGSKLSPEASVKVAKRHLEMAASHEDASVRAQLAKFFESRDSELHRLYNSIPIEGPKESVKDQVASSPETVPEKKKQKTPKTATKKAKTEKKKTKTPTTAPKAPAMVAMSKSSEKKEEARKATKEPPGRDAKLSALYKEAQGKLKSAETEEEAMRFIQTLADPPHCWPDAMFLLGFLYSEDRPKNYKDSEAKAKLAFLYWKKAAEANHEKSYLHLGYLYNEGHGTDKNVKEAKEWYKRSWFAVNSPLAALSLGTIAMEKGNVKKAHGWWLRAAKNGESHAMLKLAELYREGAAGIQKDLEKTRKWWQKAADSKPADSSNVDALMELGRLYGGTLPQPIDAIKCFQRAWDLARLPCAARSIGVLFQNGWEGKAPDYEEAFKWYLAAAELNDVDSIFNVAVAYSNGLGVEESVKSALRWYHKAADEYQDIESISALAVHYMDEDDENYDKRMGKKYLKLAAESGNADAKEFLEDWSEDSSEGELSEDERGPAEANNQKRSTSQKPLQNGPSVKKFKLAPNAEVEKTWNADNGSALKRAKSLPAEKPETTNASPMSRIVRSISFGNGSNLSSSPQEGMISDDWEQKQVADWTVLDVVSHFHRMGADEEQLEALTNEGIDGEALSHLDLKELRNHVGIGIGPSIKSLKYREKHNKD